MRFTFFFTILYLLIAPLKSYSQVKRVFDGINPYDSIILAGVHSSYDKTRKYAKFNFLLTDPVVIDSFFKSLVLGDQQQFVYDPAYFELTVIDTRTKEFISSYILNIQYGQINIDGKGYKINIEKIQKMYKTYPLKHTVLKKAFKDTTDYRDSKPILLKDKYCFLIYPPFFKYEGTFQVKFQIGRDVYSPNEADLYLNKKMRALLPENEFWIGRIIDLKNPYANEECVFSVTSKKAAYDQLRLEKGKKLKWVPQKHEASIYYKR